MILIIKNIIRHFLKIPSFLEKIRLWEYNPFRTRQIQVLSELIFNYHCIDILIITAGDRQVHWESSWRLLSMNAVSVSFTPMNTRLVTKHAPYLKWLYQFDQLQKDKSEKTMSKLKRKRQIAALWNESIQSIQISYFLKFYIFLAFMRDIQSF